MSLHGPAGACIAVASVSLIHVPSVYVLKHCGVHKIKHTRDPKQSWDTPAAHQLGCKNLLAGV